MHISRGKRHCLNKKTFFSLFFLYVCFLVCFIVLLVNVFSFFFSTLMSLLDLVSLMLFKPKCVSCVLDMHTSFCYCASLNACLDDHLLYFVIIVVMSIWLFWCMIKLLICFTSCLLDRNLLVTLYLSFYYLLYPEGLMCFVQVFQVTGIYVPSSSQLLDLGVSEFCHCSQTHV